jgi:ankyrin repeat protein
MPGNPSKYKDKKFFNPNQSYTYSDNDNLKCGEWTILMWKIKYTNIKKLSNKDIKDINKRNRDGLTALMIAIRNFNLEPSEYIRRIKLLIDAGADLYLKSYLTSSVFEDVVSNGSHLSVKIKLIKLLLTVIDLKKFTHHELERIYMCINWRQKDEIVQLFIFAGMNFDFLRPDIYIDGTEMVNMELHMIKQRYYAQFNIPLISKFQMKYKKYYYSPDVFFTTARGKQVAAELDNVFGEYDIQI